MAFLSKSSTGIVAMRDLFQAMMRSCLDIDAPYPCWTDRAAKAQRSSSFQGARLFHVPAFSMCRGADLFRTSPSFPYNKHWSENLERKAGTVKNTSRIRILLETLPLIVYPAEMQEGTLAPSS
jgi:hypothetical protein